MHHFSDFGSRRTVAKCNLTGLWADFDSNAKDYAAFGDAEPGGDGERPRRHQMAIAMCFEGTLNCSAAVGGFARGDFVLSDADVHYAFAVSSQPGYSRSGFTVGACALRRVPESPATSSVRRSTGNELFPSLPRTV